MFGKPERKTEQTNCTRINKLTNTTTFSAGLWYVFPKPAVSFVRRGTLLFFFSCDLEACNRTDERKRRSHIFYSSNAQHFNQESSTERKNHKRGIDTKQWYVPFLLFLKQTVPPSTSFTRADTRKFVRILSWSCLWSSMICAACHKDSELLWVRLVYGFLSAMKIEWEKNCEQMLKEVKNSLNMNLWYIKGTGLSNLLTYIGKSTTKGGGSLFEVKL